MATEKPRAGGQLIHTVLRFLKIFTLNSWRRLLMLGHYTLICFHQQRFRRACRILGQRVIHSLEEGEVNPMLAGEVKDSLARAQEVKKTKDRHYQAIFALREKIRATRAEMAPSPPPESETPPREAGPEAAPGNEVKSD